MRICVIFNPTARGDKARNFRRHLDVIGADCAFKQTDCAGAARRLAAEAIGEGFETVVAAGGDGTLNEVLNGIGDVPDGFSRIRLGVLPLGTVNVFAKELGIPTKLEPAWKIMRAGKEARIDVLGVAYTGSSGPTNHYFAQMAGAGLDARAVELVNWQLKKKIGPLAYIVAAVKAFLGPLPLITVSGGSQSLSGKQILIGNGRFYGGKYRVFPEADMQDGHMEVRVFEKINLLSLIRSTGMFLAGNPLPHSVAPAFRTNSLVLTSVDKVPFEVDGELIGHLPATISVHPRKLRIITP